MSICTGASTGTVLYDPQEPWSLATVITLCGVHQALPVASTQQQVAKQTWLHSWLHTALAALQRYALSRLRGILQFGVFVQNGYPAMTQKWDTYFDTRGLWANSFQATSWAYDNLFNSCKQTHETVVIQVCLGCQHLSSALLHSKACSVSALSLSWRRLTSLQQAVCV